MNLSQPMKLKTNPITSSALPTKLLIPPKIPPSTPFKLEMIGPIVSSRNELTVPRRPAMNSSAAHAAALIN